MKIDEKSWNDIVAKFDEYERKLKGDPEDEGLSVLSKSLNDELQKYQFDAEQVEIIKERSRDILSVIKELKEYWRAQSVELIETRKSFDSYLKSSSIINSNK